MVMEMWWVGFKKVQLVARLQKIDDVAKLLPLYLKGEALQLYLKIDEDQQMNINLTESHLEEDFSNGEFSVHVKLKNGNVGMDDYTRKIWQLAGHSLETAMKLTFVTGFLNDISKELQQSLAIETLTMGDLLTQARVLTKDMAGEMVATMQLPWSNSGVSFEVKPQTDITCYRCRGQSTWPETVQQDGLMG